MHRPSGVTLAAIFYIYWACISLVGALATFLMAVTGATSKDLTGATGFLIGLKEIGGVIFLVLAALSLVIGVGLLKLRSWARLGTIVLSGLNALGLLYGVVGSLLRRHIPALLADLIFLALYALVLWYMFRPHVTRAFTTADTVAHTTP